jgi:hypothetical protein
VGFYLWAGKVTQLNLSSQQWYIVLAGAGMGLMLGPASTDAVNRASKLSYGEATGITQTVRNFSASMGLAILGTISVSQFRSKVTASLVSQGAPHKVAAKIAAGISQSQGQSASGTSVSKIPHFIELDFAYATRTVFYVMAGVMAAAALVAFFALEQGLQADPGESGPDSAAGIGVPAPDNAVPDDAASTASPNAGY